MVERELAANAVLDERPLLAYRNMCRFETREPGPSDERSEILESENDLAHHIGTRKGHSERCRAVGIGVGWRGWGCKPGPSQT